MNLAVFANGGVTYLVGGATGQSGTVVYGVAVDRAGDVYISDYIGGVIKK